MPVTIFYTLEDDTTVLATVQAIVSNISFIMNGLPEQPKNYKPIRIETPDGTILTDWSVKPPSRVYVVGSRTED